MLGIDLGRVAVCVAMILVFGAIVAIVAAVLGWPMWLIEAVDLAGVLFIVSRSLWSRRTE